jgi:hypothetical protein
MSGLKLTSVVAIVYFVVCSIARADDQILRLRIDDSMARMR